MKPFILTNQEGRHFNLSSAFEYFLQLEGQNDYPKGKYPEGYNTARLVVKTVTGAVQFFPFQTPASLINEIMPGLGVNFFRRVSVVPTGGFWYDPEKKPTETIQPVYNMFLAIDGSEFRKLLEVRPEAAALSMNDKAELVIEEKIQPDEMFVNGLSYNVAWATARQMGLQLWHSSQQVLDDLEKSYPGVVANHQHRSYIEKHVRTPFEELEKIKRERKQRKAQTRLSKSGLIVPNG